MTLHPFDQAVGLQQQPDGLFLGATQPAYANMVGPFGGITAAVLLQSVMQHPQRLGEPIALTVNFAGAVADGLFTINARPVRTNRSTQHWLVELTQPDISGQAQVATTATVVTAVRRSTWGDSEVPMPSVPAPDTVPQAQITGAVAWLDRYAMHLIGGGLPQQWSGQHAPSLTQMWVRDAPPRTPDFASLAALADVFFPRIWLRRATRTPVGTVSMTVYFHCSAAQLTAVGTGHLLAQARGQAFSNGFFDQTGLLWAANGTLLCSTHQTVYYKA